MDSSLQVPEPGPSRHVHRPVSVQPTTSSAVSSPSNRKRASHQVVTSQPQQEEQPTYRDIYSHPAALEYVAAHPRRTIPKFGPYLLLQTLGEGEFGKVKLGLHMQWGEEVAVKLMRRGNIDSSVRMSKVEREIEVLRTLKHPNIVRLYDVIETDKYIGIILEYASGGELFDHILAHRYLREKDACKLFSQLISGVWYIHQKKIVHRDLKLENLLLDRHRNVIITDFGFANRFEHRADDLMQTSCGSPCYAAPELVISDGLYVGSAVDIWSCGVILYAMLAGYLPFDDDPANPDGDNINLLYKYIVNTPLSFPDYISAEARDLLSIMLVPDPARRADLETIMQHQWLAPYSHLFDKRVEDLERAAMEQHHQKRLNYQRQMKQASQDSGATKMSRSQSARTDAYASSSPVATSSRSRSTREHAYSQQAQPEYLYETSADQSVYSTSAAPSSTRRGFNSTVLATPSPMVEDDPFAVTAGQETAVPTDTIADDGAANEEQTDGLTPTGPSVKSSPEAKRPRGGFRHTIQVEYGESDGKQSQSPPRGANGVSAGPSGSVRDRDRRRPSVDVRQLSVDISKSSEKALPVSPGAEPVSSSHQRQRSETVTSAFKYNPTTAVPPIEVTEPPATPPAAEKESAPTASDKTDSASSKHSRHRKGLSIDKIGISKLFGSNGEQQTNGNVSRSPSQAKRQDVARSPSSDVVGKADVGRRPSIMQVPRSPGSPLPDDASSTALLSAEGPATNGSVKKSRRNTLTLVVEPFSRSIRSRTQKRTTVTTETPVSEKVPVSERVRPAVVAPPALPPKTPMKEIVSPSTPQYANTPRAELPPSAVKERMAVPASTVKASKVMQWFRSKSKGRVTDDESDKVPEISVIETVPRVVPPAQNSNVSAGYLTTPTSEIAQTPVQSGHSQRSASSGVDGPHGGNSLMGQVRRIGGSTPKPATSGYPDMRRHHGPLDKTTITTEPPPQVMQHVRKVLEDMGMEIHFETEYKYRCIRPKRRKTPNGVGLGVREGSSLAAFTMVGSAASNGVDKRGLPQPSQSFGTTGGMLRGLLMRRQSSQVSTTSLNQSTAPNLDESSDAILASAVPNSHSPEPSTESIYGDPTQDQGDEIRFSVELTRIDRLDNTYSLDIRRLKGNLRSYKFVYDTLTQRADLQHAI